MLLEFQSGFCTAELLRGTTAGLGCRSPADSRHPTATPERRFRTFCAGNAPCEQTLHIGLCHFFANVKTFTKAEQFKKFI